MDENRMTFSLLVRDLPRQTTTNQTKKKQQNQNQSAVIVDKTNLQKPQGER
jgi:hypothetical protein